MKNSVLDRLKSYFDEYFSDATKPTANNLFLIVVSVLTLDLFRSVRFAHRHVLSKLSDTSLNAYYYALKAGRLDHDVWRDVAVSKVLKTVPEHLESQTLFLSIDDTMVEKKGKKFELRSRLFFCTTDPENILPDCSRFEDETIRGYGEENAQFLPAACYSLRWNIEVSYYESKTFWSLEEYRVRSREGIERLINLECIAYSAMTLLPYSDESFSCYQSASAQETRYGIGQQIQANIIFSSFVEKLETVKKSCALIKIVERYILSGFKNVQKL